MKIELLQQLLVVALIIAPFSAEFIQKIKEFLKNKKYLALVSLVVNMIIGTLFTLNFTEESLVYALWVGFFTYIGADVIYKVFEDKFFKSLSTIKEEEIKYDI